MPKILFDHQKFTTQKYGGISRYFFNIIKQISVLPEFEYELGVLYSQNYYLRSEFGSRNNFLDRVFKIGFANRKLYEANQYYSNRMVKKNDFDIFHPTYYDTYYFADLKKPLVTTIHDMTYERLPEYFWAHDNLTRNKRLSAERADAIIAISEATKADLVEIYGIDESKVSVIYHGIELDTQLNFKKIDNLPEEYLLYVGDRSGYKNFYLFIDAYHKLSASYPNLNVILTGGGSLGIADQELLHRLNLEKKVRHVNVTDEELNYLYSKALIFVYPSLYEGFGLPILEAFKARCPILLSDIVCFKEIAGEAAEFFEARSLDDLFDKMKYLLDHPDHRNNLVDKGMIRLQDFPLTTSIEQTLELYSSLK